MGTTKALNLTQVGDLLGVSPQTVSFWVVRGCRVNGTLVILAGEAVGTQYRITPEAVEKFKADCMRARRGERFEPTPDPEDEREKARRMKAKDATREFLKSL